MNRSLLLGLVAALALPVAAQTPDSTSADVVMDPVMSGPMMADTTMADSAMAFQPNPAMARPLYDEGLALGRADDYAAALLKYEESLLNDPSFAPSAFGRAQALAQLGRLDDSQSAFEEAIAAARAADNGQVLTASETGLRQVQAAIAQRDAAASANASAQAMTAAVTEATELLNADPVTPETAQQAYDALERARAAGYDPNLAAFYYAKALVALDRGAEAVPYAQTALDAADASTDRSGLYIQLGLAQRAAGNMDAARASFESARDGSWSGWAEHYLREMDTAASDG